MIENFVSDGCFVFSQYRRADGQWQMRDNDEAAWVPCEYPAASVAGWIERGWLKPVDPTKAAEERGYQLGYSQALKDIREVRDRHEDAKQELQIEIDRIFARINDGQQSVDAA